MESPACGKLPYPCSAPDFQKTPLTTWVLISCFSRLFPLIRRGQELGAGLSNLIASVKLVVEHTTLEDLKNVSSRKVDPGGTESWNEPMMEYRVCNIFCGGAHPCP